MKPTGLVVVECPSLVDVSTIENLANRACSAVPDGRFLALIYQMPTAWQPSTPVESTFVRSVMGSPDRRSDDPEWEFFGNLAVRACEVRSNRRVVTRELGVTILRRLGPKPYERRSTLGHKQLEDALLPSLHPVFTRDIANNVWHLAATSVERRIRDRLGALMAWPDEDVLVIRPQSIRRYPVAQLNLDSDLIGIPRKSTYTWVTGQEQLFTA